MSYSAYTDISSQMKRIDGGFSATSTPTSTEVTSFIALIDATIDSRLSAVGVVLPVVGASALSLLKQISVDGTIALICRALDMEADQGKEHQRLFEEALARIEKYPLSLGSTAGVADSYIAGSTAEDPRLFIRSEKQW